MYTDQVNVQGKDIWNTLELAKRYQLHELVDECERLLIQLLCSDNMLLLRRGALLYGLNALEVRTLNMIKENLCELFANDDVIHLDADTLKQIIPAAIHVLSPAITWIGCYLWAVNEEQRQCQQKQEQPGRAENVLRVLQPFLTHQRLLSLENDAFLKSNVLFKLTCEERCNNAILVHSMQKKILQTDNANQSNLFEC